jgi:predicted RNase H-like nuclease (RuvC/YqgF family)
MSTFSAAFTEILDIAVAKLIAERFSEITERMEELETMCSSLQYENEELRRQFECLDYEDEMQRIAENAVSEYECAVKEVIVNSLR